MAVSPAGVLTSTSDIAHEATVFFDRVAMDNLKKPLRFYELCEKRRLPLRSGLVHQMFRYLPFAANTTAGTQGTIGTSITPTSETVQATISQYFDFVNLSDLYIETIIDDSLAAIAGELGYRAGLTVDTLIRTEFDAGSATTSTAPVGSNLSAADFKKKLFLLRGTDVRPKEGSDFLSLGHPYVLYDMVAETAAGSWFDQSKYTDSRKLFEGDELGKILGARIGASTNVGTSGAGATTKYWTYTVGAGAVYAINLGEGDVGGGRNPEVSVMRHGKSASDPAGVIGGSCAYNFKFAAKRGKTTNDSERYRQVAADSTIAS